MTRRATSRVRWFRTRMRSMSIRLYSRSGISRPRSSVIPGGGVQPSMSLSMSMRMTLYGARKAVLDSLLQAVGVNRLAEIIDVGDILSFLGRRGAIFLPQNGPYRNVSYLDVRQPD